jgi:integrase
VLYAGLRPSASTISATLLLTRGAHPRSFEELLGHSTIGIALDTYSHVLLNMQNHLTRALEDALR